MSHPLPKELYQTACPPAHCYIIISALLDKTLPEKFSNITDDINAYRGYQMCFGILTFFHNH